MKKKKKKHQGHYCRICGEHKANEKFSGKWLINYGIVPLRLAYN